MHSTQNSNKNQDIRLSVRDLTISAPSVHPQQSVLVDRLSFDLAAGEVLAMVGESGSGKSLTALALLGLLSPKLKVVGSVALTLKDQSADLLTLDDRALRSIRGRHIAMIFQEPMTALSPLHTIEKQLREALMQAGMFTQNELKTQIQTLLKQVELDVSSRFLQSYPHQISGGQRQRVMIAMALAQQPDIIIADEPTTALDVTLQQQVLNLLLSRVREQGISLILISHDLGLVRRYSDSVMVLAQGKLVETASNKQLFANPQHAYTRTLMNQQFGVMGTYHHTAENSHMLLDVRQLHVDYPLASTRLFARAQTMPALYPLDFNLQQGECLGVVGESGSGKTTLALALMRLIKSQGEIFYAGQALHGLAERDIRAFRSHIQMVFQDPFASLNPRLTVEQIIGEGIERQVLDKKQRRIHILRMLEKVKLPIDFINRYPHELSGGQRQRVALCRALIMQPKLIILDEPTSALDRTTQRELIELLRDIAQQDGVSYLFISHDLALIQALCHRVMVLYQGRMVEMNTTAELFAQPQSNYTKQLMDAAFLTVHSAE